MDSMELEQNKRDTKYRYTAIRRNTRRGLGETAGGENGERDEIWTKI